MSDKLLSQPPGTPESCFSARSLLPRIHPPIAGIVAVRNALDRASPISAVGAMSFSTVAGPNLDQHPTFDPGSSLLWELSRLKVAQGGRRPTAVLKDIAPSAVMCPELASSWQL